VTSWRPPGPAVDVELLTMADESITSREDIARLVMVYRVTWQEAM
jgi:hypothetical protein